MHGYCDTGSLARCWRFTFEMVALNFLPAKSCNMESLRFMGLRGCDLSDSGLRVYLYFMYIYLIDIDILHISYIRYNEYIQGGW